MRESKGLKRCRLIIRFLSPISHAFLVRSITPGKVKNLRFLSRLGEQMEMPDELLAAYTEAIGHRPLGSAIILSIPEEKKQRYIATNTTDIKYTRDSSALVAEDVIIDMDALLAEGVPQPKVAWPGLSRNYVNVFISTDINKIPSNAVLFDDGRQIIGIDLFFRYPTCSSKKDIVYDIELFPLYKSK